MANDFGILSFGAYLPRTRLQRKAIAAANGWFNGALRGLARGERAIGNWDEDTITMAVEAARDCLGATDRGSLRQLVLASTTHPFDDRQNATVVASALHPHVWLQRLHRAMSGRCGYHQFCHAMTLRDGR